ncbi:glutamine amidotransferase [Thermopetrobacter sp. TC1]|uniref:glutamine amidotransferase n=1 Tax=Thermopetrobacter sp. TC1 TaxID=1495045 RepID=UPI00068D2911|nr:glutamine amidotransferase [Thermopetrobacter sp. TC1]
MPNMAAARRGKRVLIVLHQATSTPGRIGHWLRQRGVELDIRYPVFGDELPASLEAHHGAIIFGGPGSVNDNCAHFRKEIDWLSVPLRENKPYIGICLGAQMLAKHLGARVGPHPDGYCEVGYYPVRPTSLGAALCDCWPEYVYQWHREGFDIPAGAQKLLEGLGYFPNQAFRFGAAFGFQFHPEVTTAMLHRWTVKSAESLSWPGARPLSTHFEDRLVHDPAVSCWLDRFLDFWLTLQPGRQDQVAA